MEFKLHTVIITNTQALRRHEGSNHTLPLPSSKKSDWVGLTFSDTKYLRIAYAHARVLICVCVRVGQGAKGKENEGGRERERTEFSPVVQLSAPIHIKPKAAESWCHGWPLDDQTCHFSYGSVPEEAETHTHLCDPLPESFSILSPTCPVPECLHTVRSLCEEI